MGRGKSREGEEGGGGARGPRTMAAMAGCASSSFRSVSWPSTRFTNGRHLCVDVCGRGVSD